MVGVVVGFEGDVVAAADFLEGGAGFGGDPVRLHFLPRLSDEDQVGMEFVDHMAAVAYSCSAIRLALYADHTG